MKTGFGRKGRRALCASAMAAALALLATGCGDSGGGGGGGSGPGWLGDALSLGGQVWTMQWGSAGPAFQHFTGSTTVSSNIPGAQGEIDGGLLDFAFGAPHVEHLQPLEALAASVFGWTLRYFDNLHIGNANAALLWLHTATNRQLERIYARDLSTPTVDREIDYLVTFIFVEQDAAISGRGAATIYDECDCEEWDGACFCGACDCADWPLTVTTRTFNITLREGWNAVRKRVELRDTAASGSDTISLYHANPGMPVRWVYGGFDSFHGGLSADLPESRERSGQALPARPCRRPSGRPASRARR